MKGYLFLLCSIVTTTTLAENLTLTKAYEEAYKNNPNLKVSYQKRIIAEEQTEQAFAPLLPTVHASLGKNKYFKSTSTATSYKNNPSTYESDLYELKLTQPIFNTTLYGNYTKAELKSKISQLEYFTSKQDLILQVASVYLDFLSNKDRLLVSKLKLQTLEQQKAEIEKKFDLGEATVQDLGDTDSKYYLASSEQSEMSLNVDISKAKLAEIIGSSLENYEDISDMKLSSYLVLDDDVEAYINVAFENNFALQAKRLNLLYSQEDIESKKEEYYPKLDLIGSISRYEVTQGATSEGYHSNQNYLGLQLVAPLYEGGMTTSKIREAKEIEQLSKNELEAYQSELRFNILKEYKGLKTTESQIKSLEVAFKAASTTVEAAKVGFNVGARTHFEVLQAIEQYYSIRNSLADTKYKYKLGELKLKMLLGSLNGDDLVD